MLQSGDFIALVDMAIAFILKRREQGKLGEILEIRDALKKLHFSKETIRRLEAIPNAKDADMLIYHAGQAAIRQRDTRGSVEQAFRSLEKFGKRQGLSIRAGRLLDEIRNVKFGIRHEIELSYFNVIKTGTSVQTDSIVEKINCLNTLIEELDDRLDGAVLGA